MDDMFFYTVKDLFRKDPKLEEDFMQKIGLVYGLNTFRNIPEAMQSMVQGNVIVGFSVAKKDDNIGIAFDNAYRIKDENNRISRILIPESIVLENNKSYGFKLTRSVVISYVEK